MQRTHERESPCAGCIVEGEIACHGREARDVLAVFGKGRFFPVATFVVVFAEVPSGIDAGFEILAEVEFHTHFDALHISVAHILPLVGITQPFHVVVGRHKFDLVAQVGSEEIGTQLVVLAIIVGGEVHAERTLAFERGRFPHAGRSAAKVEVFREAVGRTVARTDIGTQNQCRRHFIFHGKTGIDGRLVEVGFGECAVEDGSVGFILLSRIVHIDANTGNDREVARHVPFVLEEEAEFLGVLLADGVVGGAIIVAGRVVDAIHAGFLQLGEICLEACEQTVSAHRHGIGRRTGEGVFLGKVGAHEFHVGFLAVVRLHVSVEEGVVGGIAAMEDIGKRQR